MPNDMSAREMPVVMRNNTETGDVIQSDGAFPGNHAYAAAALTKQTSRAHVKLQEIARKQAE